LCRNSGDYHQGQIVLPLGFTYSVANASIVGDIGVHSSCDPVAIDQASIDLVNEQSGNERSRLKAHLGPGRIHFEVCKPKSIGGSNCDMLDKSA
jgi:hypothetical protein